MDLALPGYYSSHDGIGHVIRMEEFYRSLKDGNIPVRWSERLYYGYGYPFFNFNYPSIYYLGAALMAPGLSAADAMKLETAGSFVLSGLLMYWYLRRKIKGEYAVLGAVLYMYAPYRMSNIYVRGSVAEAIAFIFPPLLLWSAETLTTKGKRNILWVALIVGALGVSHNISAMLLAAFFFGYLAILGVANKSIIPLVKGAVAFALGILMAAFFLVPALYEKKWTFLDLTIAKDYPNYFVSPLQLIDPRWSFGAVPLNLGWIQLALVVVALRYIRRNILLVFSLLMFLVSIFFMLPISKIFWDHVPLLPFVQFPWRFTMLTLPAMAVLGAMGVAAAKASRKAVIILVVLTILSVSYTWWRNQTEYAPVFPGDAIPGSTTWAHEQATRWLVPKPDSIPAQKIENANYQITLWKTNEHDYVINNVGKSGLVTENTMYYPGWEVFVDGVETPINYDNGKINYLVLPGTHQIKTIFTETPLRKTVDLLSLGVFGIVVLGLLLSYVVPEISSKH
ncbi:6-pyruvoyl-tetrahydropterin synthase-related protein [Patescibacteria group bacterium]|nr:6-pyruvoyl-tetrahydropterin synthase-related protein [Patescibacteria group bacterium]